MRALQACRAWVQGLGSLIQTAGGVESTAVLQHRPFAVRQGNAETSSTTSVLQQQASAAAHQQQQRSISTSSGIWSSPPQSIGLHVPLQHQLLQQQPQRPCQHGASPLNLLHQQHHQQRVLQPQFGSSVRHFVMQPRRVKYRKAHKSQGFNETICPNTRQLAFGLFGIRAMEHCRMPARTIEAARRTLRRTIKKSAMLWIRVTPNVPVTSKPAEVRMGKGKGTLDYWAAPIRPGQIIFEMDRCTKTEALAALKSIEAKMPMKVGFVEWN